MATEATPATRDDEDHIDLLADTLSLLTTVDTSDRTIRYTAPLQGKSYLIIEKYSGRAITVCNDEVHLSSPHEYTVQQRTWLLTSTRNYLGFFNEQQKKFISHDGKPLSWGQLKLGPTQHISEALFSIQHEANEWYRITSPEDCETLLFVTVALDGTHLERRQYGQTFFKFVEVESMGEAKEATP
ncbi:hypothetical protein F5Y18DRAFT_440301 [Xylariaceae sp. FL1019]|nr:hypothetical protein F5Y18DRAFT_440301 [Xylariaceae sp. FL1019]